jgi:hypothetical protein
MKRMLLVVAAALMFLSTLAVPTVVNADGMPSCSGACRP